MLRPIAVHVKPELPSLTYIVPIGTVESNGIDQLELCGFVWEPYEMRVDKEIPIPLYYQIVEQLRSYIRTGIYKPGERIPPERQLSEELGVSRMTVHQAVSYLVNLGALNVRRGAGTFVTEPKISHDTLRILGFQEEITRQGGSVTSLVLEQELGEPSEAVRQGLKVSPGELVVRLVRLRSAWDTPLLLERSYLPATICPGLEELELANNSLYRILARNYGLTLVRSNQSLEASVASSYEAHLFGVPEGAPMVLLESVTYDVGDRPVEFCKALYRGDRFRFQAQSHGAEHRSTLLLQLNDTHRVITRATDAQDEVETGENS